MARNRKIGDIGDWIPVGGEGRVLAEIKGKVGRASMKRRSNFRRGNRRYNSSNPAAEWSPLVYGNVNWGEFKPNLLWNTETGIPSAVQRIVSFNADTVASGESQPDITLKRLDIQQCWMAGMGAGRIDGTLQTQWSRTFRDDIPAFSGFPDTSGYTGVLVSGDLDNGSLIGPTSFMEGIPLNLALIYETESEAQQDIAALMEEPLVVGNVRNKRIFWQKLICPTIYRPAMVNIDKQFSGRGVALRKGAREIYQVSLIAFSYSDMGTVIKPAVTFVSGTQRALYFEAAVA